MKNRSKTKELAAKFYSKAEDIFLKMVLLLPDQLVPNKIMERYLQKRIRELEQQQIKANWNLAYLSRAAQELKNK